jgi:hypothetical protein
MVCTILFIDVVLGWLYPRFQPRGKFVMPAYAGIQFSPVLKIRLDSGFRRNDWKTEEFSPQSKNLSAFD